MSEIKLLPCPFCGGEARVRGEKFYQPNVRRNVICTKCFSNGGWYKTEEEAIEKWNTRKPMQEIVEKLKKRQHINSMSQEFRLSGSVSYYEAKYMAEAFEESIEIVKEVGGING